MTITDNECSKDPVFLSKSYDLGTFQFVDFGKIAFEVVQLKSFSKFNLSFKNNN